MIDRRAPSLTEQIDAVEWAEAHALAMGKRAHLRPGEIDELRRRLEAAAETLRTLEYGSEIAR
jgi:hypothetical protein